MLVRLARESEVGPGQMIEKMSHDKKLLIVRSNQNTVAVMDAHCFHMGTALVGGDIEDLAGHVCVVCPAHRYRIDVSSGCVVDTDLCGNACMSADQKQRTYTTHTDGEFIWVDLPEVTLAPLPSDYYNKNHIPINAGSVMPEKSTVQQQGGVQNYGLFGPAPVLMPYAGVTSWPVVQGNTGSNNTNAMGGRSSEAAHQPMAEEPQIIFSQQQQQQSPQQQQDTAGRISFPAARVDSARLARRKAATAAILSKSYKPPVASVVTNSIPVVTAAEQQPAATVVRQATLFETWAKAPSPVAATNGPEGMDMN